MKFVLFSFLMALFSGNVFAYRMMCRGPFEIINKVDHIPFGPVAKIKKNLYPSGAQGERLATGTCAWLDRRISTAEPDKLYIGVFFGETALPWSLEYLHYLLMKGRHREKMLRERLEYLTRSDYVVEFDVVQDSSTGTIPHFTIIRKDEYHDDAYMRLIPVRI
ncbi:MAG: hypothetical protein NDI69_10895 [Bacteriovoracaceae bacterium]|nr:hypothetical protein [Bacteriovoracaceae bacterium]